jgi:hypothetical protein
MDALWRATVPRCEQTPRGRGLIHQFEGGTDSGCVARTAAKAREALWAAICFSMSVAD